jgi:hypothetical protein
MLQKFSDIVKKYHGIIISDPNNGILITDRCAKKFLNILPDEVSTIETDKVEQFIKDASISSQGDLLKTNSVAGTQDNTMFFKCIFLTNH